MSQNLSPESDWVHHGELPSISHQLATADWAFYDVRYAAPGSCEGRATRLHISHRPDALRLATNMPCDAPAAPSAAVFTPGQTVRCGWHGGGRGRHLMLAPEFVAAILGDDFATLPARPFADNRQPDATDAAIGQLMSVFADEIARADQADPLFLQTLAAALVHYVARHTPSRTNARGGLAPRQLRRILDAIETRLSERLDLTELANVIGTSTRYLCRAFRQSTGHSPHQYILRRRIDRACDLIRSGDLSLADIAHATGFAGHSQMTATFQRILQAPPSHFRTQSRSRQPRIAEQPPQPGSDA